MTVIATDHAPHAIEEKNKPIDKAPFGIIGNQHAFSLMYTYIVKKGLISLEKVLTCMSLNPAKIIGIDHDLEVGKMANFVVFDLDEEYTCLLYTSHRKEFLQNDLIHVVNKLIKIL